MEFFVKETVDLFTFTKNIFNERRIQNITKYLRWS